MRRLALVLTIGCLIATGCSDSADRAQAEEIPERTVSRTETTIARTTTSTTTTTTVTSTPTSTITVPVFPPGDAGHRGLVGCRSVCPLLDARDLDGMTGVVLENVRIRNPTGRCLTIRGATDIVIRHVTFIECGTEEAVWEGYDTGLILIENSTNVTIEDSVITRMAGEDTGAARNNAIHIEDSTHVRIVNNEISDVFSDIERKAGDQGNRAISAQGDVSHLTIEENTFRNAGRNALQLARARGLAGVRFSRNVVEGRGPWDSDYEDMINLYSSSGREGDPIVIDGNYLRNGGPSVSGTAMILGDGDPENGPTANVIAADNVIVNPGHAGIVLAGGRNIVVRDNIVLGDVDVPHPTTTGLAINDYGFTGGCSDHIVTGNRVFMRNQYLEGEVNHAWIPGTCTDNVVIEDNVLGDESLDGTVWNPR